MSGLPMVNRDYCQILDRLLDTDVRFAVIRGHWWLLGDEDRLADIDLLVAPEDIPRFHATLSHAGFWRWEHATAYTDKWTTVTLPGLRSMALDRRVAAHPDGMVVGRLSVGEVLERVEEGPGGYPILHPDDEFWALFLHVVVTRSPEEREAYRPILDRLHATGRVLPFTPGADPGWALADLRGSRQELMRKLEVEWSAPPLTRPPRVGCTVALVGPDGSGKSTLIRTLEEHLPYTRRVYMGLRDFVLPTTRFFYWRVARREELEPAGPAASEPREPEKSGERARGGRSALRRIGYGLYMLNHHLEFLAKFGWGYFWARRGRVVFFDRFVYDAMELPTDSFEGTIRGRLLDSFPRPDLLVLLRPPIEVMLERKQERPREFYERYYSSYDERLTTMKGRLRVLTLDTSESLEACARKVIVEVQQMRSRVIFPDHAEET